MSILATSSTAIRIFDMNIAAALNDVNAAVIIQQLNYWMDKEGTGVVIDEVKYVYNSFRDWVIEQFKWLTVWKFRKAMTLLRSLGIVKVIRYKAKQWNQTNYYTLDSDRLNEFLATEIPESIEISEMRYSTNRDRENQTLEIANSSTSYIDPKNTTKKDLTNKQSVAAPENSLNNEKNSQEKTSQNLSASFSQIKQESKSNKSNPKKESNSAQVDSIVNKNWKDLISILDGAGISVNKTLIGLLKLYSKEQVEGAIALVRARKREQHIPNPAGYFVSALKGDWGSKTLVDPPDSADKNSEKISRAELFRHWYDLARELGYCSGEEVREGEQWIILSGSWEKWEAVVNRGYTLEYLKKIMKRNQNA